MGGVGPAAAILARETAAGGLCRILHLEDSAVDADLIAERLRFGGLDAAITRVDGREEFIAALRRGGIDLILADFSLPAFDGISALALARQEAPRVPFIFVSGTLGEDAAVEALKDGATDYVVKQRLTRLPAAVARALEEARTAARKAEAEAHLHESQVRLGAIVAQAAVGIVEVDTEGRFLLVNDRLCEILGRTRKELLGLRTDDVTHPEDRPVSAALFRRTVETGEPYAFDKRYLRPDGALVWGRVHVSLARGVDGRALSVIGVVEDITERRRAEQELRRLNETLELRVASAVDERGKAEEALAQARKMEALGQLAGGVAHDFNNVLQTVLGAARLLQRRPNDAAAVARLAQLVSESAERGAAVARRLLSFARRGELRAAAADPVEIIEGLREVFVHTLGAAIRVEAEVGQAVPALMADRAQLETTLVNLATNARDAMPDGGTLALSAEAEEVSGAAGTHPVGLAPGRYVRLRIADTGVGMPPEILARAAEPFFTTKAREAGTGLGLAMARGFAEQSGGALHVESAPGRGTTVSLWLPQAPPAGQRPQARPAGADGAAAPADGTEAQASVLLVDDEPHIREVLEAGLKEQGFRVEAVEDARTALALLRSGRAMDLLITDLAMPGLDGLALIRAARSIRPGLPTLLVTGHAGDAAAAPLAAAAGQGPFALLRKPVAPEDIAARASMLVRGGGW
jgi:PAS domain S-box-containing protein